MGGRKRASDHDGKQRGSTLQPAKQVFHLDRETDSRADDSSKVSLEYPKDKIPPILAFSDVIGRDHPSDAESIHSTALQANLATFISSLVFWQDVLERCPSHDIKATLLDHFDFLFLRPLL